MRRLNAGTEISPLANIKINVDGMTSPLIGDEKLLKKDIYEKSEYLLRRRGFNITSENYEYSIAVKYKTEQITKSRVEMSDYSSNLSINSSSQLSSGYGIMLSRLIGIGMSSSKKKQIVEDVSVCTHTLSIEALNAKGDVIWQGEAQWETSQLNILDEIVPVLQLLFSNLPSKESSIANVPKVKVDLAYNYFSVICRQSTFACPALPYYIRFNYSDLKAYDYLPRYIENPEALAAFVDLVQTAEFALPMGNKKWDNPISRKLWQKTMLGGKYRLGEDNNTVNVLVKLSGTKECYKVDKCYIASDEEYNEYLGQLKLWQNTLKNYFDYYE
ncbi:MAG: hypothetical protein ABIE07_07765 [Candidatus Zixiibacteriota bacterium]